MSGETVQAATQRLIELLRQGEEGFRNLSVRIADPECKAFLRQESIMRGIYADQLERSAEVRSLDLPEAVGRPGLFQRQWSALKARLAVGDHALLKTAETCEWFAVQAYEKTLCDGAVPAPLHDLIASQSRGIRQSHKIVQEFRRRFHR